MSAMKFYEREILEMVGDSPQREAVQAVAKTAAAAFRQHQVFLEKELLRRSTAEWRLGKERFAQKLEKALDAGALKRENHEP